LTAAGFPSRRQKGRTRSARHMIGFRLRALSVKSEPKLQVPPEEIA
jgi:hypothetical protein